MSRLRVVFMGTPTFVIPVLESVERMLPAVDGEIVAVYTAPDRPVGRGRRLTPSPVKEYAGSKGYGVLTPARLRNEDETTRFEGLGANFVVLAAYGLILPKVFLLGPEHGAVNVHPSLLPRHRGASPVAAAILAGDSITGVTVMKMDEGLDTGPVLARKEVELSGHERAPELTDRLFRMGGDLLEESVPRYLRGELVPEAQANEGVSVVKRFAKEDAWLDWSRPAVELERRVRAFDPWPGTATEWHSERLEVLSSRVGPQLDLPPGSVTQVGRDIAVATPEGSLILEQVRPAGRKTMDARAFVAGHTDFLGSVLPS